MYSVACVTIEDLFLHSSLVLPQFCITRKGTKQKTCLFSVIKPGLSCKFYCSKGVIAILCIEWFRNSPQSMLVNILFEGMFCFTVHYLVVYCVNRALKTKHDTPKYGLIFHASLVGQTTPKHKGKVCKSTLAT